LRPPGPCDRLKRGGDRADLFQLERPLVPGRRDPPSRLPPRSRPGPLPLRPPRLPPPRRRLRRRRRDLALRLRRPPRLVPPRLGRLVRPLHPPPGPRLPSDCPDSFLRVARMVSEGLTRTPALGTGLAGRVGAVREWVTSPAPQRRQTGTDPRRM